MVLVAGRYGGHDAYADPYGAATPHPYDHSPFQTVPNVGQPPSDPWVPPTDLGHHNAMTAQVRPRTASPPNLT